MAQDESAMRQIRLDFSKQLQKRVPEWKDLPPAPATKGTQDAKYSYAGNLPTDRWFPGEWDEVQAIVVTPYYMYEPISHQGVQTWYADPMVSHYAQYYKYTSSGWTENGRGDYVAVLDTTDDAFLNVFYYLMDGIQLGGAQAWVHLEQESDSLKVLGRLATMGLRHDNIRFFVGPGNSFWYRDCGPIAFYYGSEDSVAMLDFMYYPGRALDDSIPSLIEAQMGIPNYITSIEWEGGNCIVDGTGVVFSSDALYGKNADTYGQLKGSASNPSSITYETKEPLTKQQVRDSLEYLMGPRGVKILPKFKYDGGTGHIDLYADMWNESGFVFSKFPANYSSWTDYATAAKNIDSICSWQTLFGENYAKSYIPFPCTDNGGTFRSQAVYNTQYTRTYSNHTFVNDVLLQPCFSTVVDGEPSAEWDRLRIDSLRAAYPGYRVYPIDVRQFDGSGGAIHCITKQIPAANPIRFIHQAYMGKLDDAYRTQDLTLQSYIHNRSGISQATLHWRVDGGVWNDVAMNAQGNDLYTATIPTSTIVVAACDTCYAKIEYYIEATSSNGKTMTKPITAANGGYFTCTLGDYDPLGIASVETAEGIGQFYPNPALDQVHINMKLGEGTTYQVSILDMSGRMVHSSTLQASGNIRYTIETSNFASGIYTVLFNGDGRKIARRLVVR